MDDKSEFDEKSIKKLQMYELQIKLFHQLIKLVPIEYIDVNYSFICFLLN
jgi:hypothetical protein